MFCLVGPKHCEPCYKPAKSVLKFNYVEYLATFWKKRMILYVQKGRRPGKKYTENVHRFVLNSYIHKNLLFLI